MISGITRENEFERAGPSAPLAVRKAGMRDIEPLLRLINGYASQGIMLARTEFEISESVRDFSVIYAEEKLVGCGALHFYSPVVGEIRSLAVAEEAKVRGVGRLMIRDPLMSKHARTHSSAC